MPQKKGKSGIGLYLLVLSLLRYTLYLISKQIIRTETSETVQARAVRVERARIATGIGSKRTHL